MPYYIKTERNANGEMMEAFPSSSLKGNGEKNGAAAAFTNGSLMPITTTYGSAGHHMQLAPESSSSGCSHISPNDDDDDKGRGGFVSGPSVPRLSRPTSSAGLTSSTRSYQSRPAFAEHLGKHRQYWRDIILGVNDGLVSTFLLVAGVVGGGLSAQEILLTAVAGAIAGAISMCAGEFVATKSQDEVLRGEIALENEHVNHYRRDELKELSELLTLIGIPKEEEGRGGKTGSNNEDPEGGTTGGGKGESLRRQMLSFYDSNPEALLQIMVALEFGVLEEERRSPWLAGLTSCALFFLGSLPSVIPFACIDKPVRGLFVSGIATGIALFGVGAVKTWATRGNLVTAAIENLLIAGVGGVLAYGVGAGFEKLIN